MKAVWVFIFIFLSQVTWATSWYDLELEDNLALTQDLIINEALEISYKTKEKFLLDNIIPLSINVVIYQFIAGDCKTPIPQAMVLLNAPEYNGRDVVVGVTHNMNCMIEVFIENRDLFAESYFEKVKE